ncbi:MAG: NAD(P)H-hydrate epimerase, partial [Candidatus Flemingiibacterium sp.]
MINVASVENMKKSDLYTTENLVPAIELMARAAREIFDAVNGDGGWRAPVAVVCGIGNNAGDGFAVAELLADAGIDCTIFLLSEKFTDSGRYYFERCAEKDVRVSRELELSGYGTVLDCIFGMGFHGEVGEPYR